MPSRISVVLVEEAKVRGTECLVPPCVDKDPRLLAGVADPASVTVIRGGKISSCVVGTLSPSDSDSVGPCGTLSLSDSDAVGPVGTDGTLSSSDLAGILFLAYLLGDCSQWALLALLGRCPRPSLILLALLACMGCCPHPTLTALLAHMGRCPRLTLLL